jgi:hypothetical protein
MTAAPHTDQQPLRDRIAEAIRADLKKAIPPWEPFPGGPKIGGMGRTEYDLADAVLAVVQPELDQYRAKRDQFADRVDTLTAVCKSNALAHRVAVEECERLRTELTRRRTEDLNLRGTLAPADLPRRIPMPLGESLVPVVEWLLTELDQAHAELAATEARLAAVLAAVLALPANEPNEYMDPGEYQYADGYSDAIHAARHAAGPSPTDQEQ